MGPPQRVLRFYGKIEYALECIALKQITLIHRDKINDPFDPYIYFETDFNADYQVLINHVQQYHGNSLQQFRRCLPKENWESFVNRIEDYFKKLRNSTFVFSTCEISEGKHPKDNLYMWSHYGNGHRGVAIEFDTTLLGEAVLEEQERLREAKLEPWFEINYQDDVPKIICEHIFQHFMKLANNAGERALEQTELAKTLRLIPSSKSMVWKVEKEWRLWKQNDEIKFKIFRLNLIDDSITAVYLGCRIDEHMIADFVFETKRNFPKAEIFKGGEKKGKFALDFGRIAGPTHANT